jgi:hypothetical protein
MQFSGFLVKLSRMVHNTWLEKPFENPFPYLYDKVQHV